MDRVGLLIADDINDLTERTFKDWIIQNRDLQDAILTIQNQDIIDEILDSNDKVLWDAVKNTDDPDIKKAEKAMSTKMEDKAIMNTNDPDIKAELIENAITALWFYGMPE